MSSLSVQVFSSGETSRTQDSSNCSVIKGVTEQPRLVYVNERERKQNEQKVEKIKPRKLPRGITMVITVKTFAALAILSLQFL